MVPADIKLQVLEANLQLQTHGLVILTWGNVSAVHRESGTVIIKPSGVPYHMLKAEDMVVVDFDGKVVEGRLRPSSDTPTHIELYKAFPSIGAVVHTHSTYAVAWAQALRPIPPFGTTHADYFQGAVRCTRMLSKEEIEGNYEAATGKLIASTIAATEAMSNPGILVGNHGPFSWGTDPQNAVYHAIVLEEIARMAFLTVQLGASKTIPAYLLNKHYQRKHGKSAYYGQKAHG